MARKKAPKSQAGTKAAKTKPKKAKRSTKAGAEKSTGEKANGGLVELTKELWQSAVTLRGSIEPSDYKRYVLPIIFLRFLSLRYEKRRAELERLVADPKSDYHGDEAALEDPDEYKQANTFIVPPKARWSHIVKKVAPADDVKLQMDKILKLLEDTYPEKLNGLLPRIYAGSNMEPNNLRDLINLFAKDIFEADHNGEDVIGRVYEYFIGEFASSEGKRGGEYFTPSSIVKTLVAMLEPERGKVFDPCCGSGGMFVQSDKFTKHSGRLSFYGQESKDFTWRLCKMNLFIHGLDGDIQMGNSYWNDQHEKLKADYVIANPPFNDGSKAENGWGAHNISRKDARLNIGGVDPNVLPLASRNANTLWILHFLHHLGPKGIAGFVMATGELSTHEKARLETRRALVELDYIDCVVQLPGQLFANTGIPCALWFLSRGRSGHGQERPREGELLFIDARKMGALIPGSRKQKQLSDAEIGAIADVYRQYRRSTRPDLLPGFSAVATTEEVRNNRYALSPGRFVGASVEDDEDEVFEERFPALRKKLLEHFANGETLNGKIRDLLQGVADGV